MRSWKWSTRLLWWCPSFSPVVSSSPWSYRQWVWTCSRCPPRGKRASSRMRENWCWTMAILTPWHHGRLDLHLGSHKSIGQCSHSCFIPCSQLECCSPWACSKVTRRIKPWSQLWLVCGAGSAFPWFSSQRSRCSQPFFFCRVLLTSLTLRIGGAPDGVCGPLLIDLHSLSPSVISQNPIA